MLRTARITDALRGRGKTLAVTLGAAAALAGAGSASAVLTSGGAIPTAYHAYHATPAHVTAATKRTGTSDAATHVVANPAPKAPSVLSFGTHAAPSAPAAKTPVAPAQHQAPAQQPTTVAPVSAPAAPAPAQPAAPAAPAPAPQPYQMYDSVTPSAIPNGQPAAVYADGPYAASAPQVTGHSNVTWIDTNGSDPRANALDVEPGDATPQQAATWVWQKLSGNENQTAIVYTMRSEWPATQAAIASLPAQMQSHVKWWIADPTGVPHMVPGADATQWYWGQNYDISMANPGF